jgi:hypothetical protein
VLSRMPLANSRGSEALILNRDREGAVVTSKAGRHTSGRFQPTNAEFRLLFLLRNPQSVGH